jgi:hypothetical protein
MSTQTAMFSSLISERETVELCSVTLTSTSVVKTEMLQQEMDPLESGFIPINQLLEHGAMIQDEIFMLTEDPVLCD